MTAATLTTSINDNRSSTNSRRLLEIPTELRHGHHQDYRKSTLRNLQVALIGRPPEGLRLLP